MWNFIDPAIILFIRIVILYSQLYLIRVSVNYKYAVSLVLPLLMFRLMFYY